MGPFSASRESNNQLRLSLLCTRRRKFMLKLISKLSKSEENVELYRPDIYDYRDVKRCECISPIQTRRGC